jgi:hypothetical protein
MDFDERGKAKHVFQVASEKLTERCGLMESQVRSVTFSVIAAEKPEELKVVHRYSKQLNGGC